MCACVNVGCSYMYVCIDVPASGFLFLLCFFFTYISYIHTYTQPKNSAASAAKAMPPSSDPASVQGAFVIAIKNASSNGSTTVANGPVNFATIPSASALSTQKTPRVASPQGRFWCGVCGRPSLNICLFWPGWCWRRCCGWGWCHVRRVGSIGYGFTGPVCWCLI